MKLFSFIALAFCFALTSCGGGGGDTLNAEERGLFVGADELDQNDAVQRLADNRSGDTVIKAECERLESLSNSGKLSRIDVLNLEADGTVRAVYFNEFGLFDPAQERLEIEQDFYVLGRIVDKRGNFSFENTKPAFGKTTISTPDEDSVISTNKSIQRTSVQYYSSEQSNETDVVRFTTDTVGSFGIENRTSFEYKRVDEQRLQDMMSTVQQNCIDR